MRDVLLGLDLGTSGVKAILLDPDGPILAEETVEYPLLTPLPGWCEQNPEDWWTGVCRAIRGVIERAGVDPSRIAGLATSGQMHGATVLDQSGVPIRPCILWNDGRSGPQCVAITEEIGLDRLVNWVGNPALAGFTAPKLLWMRDHEPEAYARIALVLLPKDYVNYRLTGVAATEVSDASGTLLFDVAQRRWSDHMLEALGINPAILPPVTDSTDVVGVVTREAARETGLREGTPVVAGGADNACAAVGAGIVSPGSVLTSIGTSGTVVAPILTPQTDPEARLHMFCHAVPDTWYLMGVVLSAGGSLRWLRDTLAPDGSLTYDDLMAEAAGVPIGSEGLVFLPYLTGERTPHGDPDARGVFFGLSLRHSRAHLARSVVEGVTYALRDSTVLMRDLGISVETIRTTGGGARSPLWRQIQADTLDARIVPVLSEVGPALGAAILAGTGVGVYASVMDGAGALVRTGDATEPTPEGLRAYAGYSALYDSLYPALRDRFHTLAHLVRDSAL